MGGSGVSTGDEFSNYTSYQRKSICWLAFGDRLKRAATDPFLEQRYALAAIFYAFDEPSSLSDQGWLSGKSECDWIPMVTCDARTHTTVSELRLPSVGLTGTLPKEMGILKHVAYINLSGNDLNGDISTAIGGWSRLETLQLSRNNFDIIPSSLKDWKVLKHFDISENDLDGSVPKSICSLRDSKLNEFITDCYDNLRTSVDCDTPICCTGCGEPTSASKGNL